jgi:MinD-like ATPase involved in chromosome partitioning or flagellar assembly
MASLNAVHFADGFDGPDTVALGLEAPELSAVVGGGLLTSAIVHSPAPAGVRLPAAALVALMAAALGWVRPQGRSLLRWGWLAARFAAAPRSGAGWLAASGGDRIDGGAEDGATAEPEPAWARWLRHTVPGRDREPAPATDGVAEPEVAEAPAAEAPVAEPGRATAAPAPRRRRRPAAAASRPGVDDDGATVEVRRPPIVLLPETAAGGDCGEGAEAEEAEPEPATIVPLCRPAAALEVAEACPVPPSLQAADALAPVFVGATRRITFFSLNGGAGRTTLATELACLLAARGRHRPGPGAAARPLRVALLDLDLRSATVAVRLGIPQPTLWDYLLSGDQGPGALDRHMVTHGSGARALLGPPKPLSGGTAVEPARVAEIVHRLECDGTHFILFDVGADLGAVTTWVLSAAHDIYVVLTPTASGVQDAYRSTEALRRLGLGSKLRYVVNRARPGIDLDEVMGDLGGRIAASIPFDPRIEEAENGHRIASLDGGGPAAEALAGLAAQVYPALSPPAARRRLRLFGRRRVG